MLPSSTPSLSETLYKSHYQKKYDYKAQGSYLFFIDNYDHLTDSISINGPFSKSTNAYHPVLTDSSWIRAAPEGGTVLGTIRSDDKRVAITNYQTLSVGDRINRYYNGTGLLRPLFPGEIEVHSKGLAQSHYSRYPILENKGGCVRQWLDQSRLTLGAKAPCHQRICHEKVAGTITDEERFGIVKRYKDGSSIFEKYFEVEASANTASPNSTSGWAKEYLRVMSNATGKLEDLRVGDVIDDDGVTKNLVRTGNPLRYRHEIFMDGSETSVLAEIDNKGNIDITFPETCDNLTVTNAGKHISLRTKKDYSLISDEGHLKVRVKESSMFECKKFGIGSANEKAVLGNQLKALLLAILNALITHTHTGNLGAPTTGPILGLAELQNALNTVNSDSILSDFIFMSKAAS